jgi:uncharacterized membrane protein YphA (DoxX/SURF4 family)
MQKISPFIQLYLRLALGIGYLVPGLDRLGVWGKPGQPGISWGDWQHFMQYAGDVMRFLPYNVAYVFAVIATIAEISFGMLLITGKFTRAAAAGSGVLTLLFGTAMATSHGVVEPLSYSVFTVSAGSFLLATTDNYKWSLDALATKKHNNKSHT